MKEVSTLEGDIMSHEQLKQKEEYDKMMAIANAHKKRVRDNLAELTAEYNKLIKAYVFCKSPFCLPSTTKLHLFNYSQESYAASIPANQRDS